MRSRTLPSLPGRCARCYQRAPFCLCREIPIVETRTGFVVVRHCREAPKSTGTARVAALALPKLEIRPYGERDRPFDGADLGRPGTWLLFLADGPATADVRAPPERIVVLDGTWHQARTMFKKIPALRALPRLHLQSKHPSMFRLRQPTVEGGMSTLEAIAGAVELLEGERLASPLYRLNALWTERCMAGRGRPLDPQILAPFQA